MANTSSALKAIRSSAKKKLVNDELRTGYRAAVKELTEAVEAGEKQAKLQELLAQTYKKIDKAAKKRHNVLDPNKAARLKSKYARLVEQKS